uniref:C-type lectin domain-containing protein n=1 Tax=Esox lucius TaxID=8010 RepID=A0A3P8XVK3_ESOLU
MFHLIHLFILGLSSFPSCLPNQYQFINMTKTWSQAQLYCRENYSDLVTIGNQTEMDELINALPAGWSGPAWIGLYNISWTWSLNNTQLEGSGFWDVGQPDNVNDNEFCVTQYTDLASVTDATLSAVHNAILVSSGNVFGLLFFCILAT